MVAVEFEERMSTTKLPQFVSTVTLMVPDSCPYSPFPSSHSTIASVFVPCSLSKYLYHPVAVDDGVDGASTVADSSSDTCNGRIHTNCFEAVESSICISPYQLNWCNRYSPVMKNDVFIGRERAYSTQQSQGRSICNVDWSTAIEG